MNRSRRIFLTGLAALMVPLGGCPQGNETKSVPQLELPFASISPKEFDPAIRELPVETIKRTYIPIGPRRPADETIKAEVQAEVMQIFNREIERGGYDPNGTYDGSVSLQMYGIPASKELSEPLIAYAKRAEAFMYARFPSLKRAPLEWRAIQSGDDFSENYEGKALVGNNGFIIVTASIVNRDDPRQRFDASKKIAFTGALAHTNANGGAHLYLSTNSGGLHTPFSELLPVTINHTRGVPGDPISMEAVTEGLAYHLSKDLLTELGLVQYIPVLESRIEADRRLERYQFVGPSINWITEHSPEEAMAIYLESPQRYLEVISQ